MIQRLWFLCSQWLMPKRRYLVDGEKKLAETVFGSYLHLHTIEIVAHRWILNQYAMSPNGNIYFNPKQYCDDFSKQSLAMQAWFIHELVHVWQLQQGMAVIRKAIFDRRYHYVLTTGKSFFQYGIEQQAQMVQDYFIKFQRGEDCQTLQQCIPFLSTQT